MHAPLLQSLFGNPNVHAVQADYDNSLMLLVIDYYEVRSPDLHPSSRVSNPEDRIPDQTVYSIHEILTWSQLTLIILTMTTLPSLIYEMPKTPHFITQFMLYSIRFSAFFWCSRPILPPCLLFGQVPHYMHTRISTIYFIQPVVYYILRPRM